LQITCTCGTVAQVGFPDDMRGRWLTCTCPGCGCRLGGRAEETPRPVEMIDCADCGKRHYSVGTCRSNESEEVYEPRSYLEWEHTLTPTKRLACRTTTRFVRCGSQ
jgi:hypothetical protein